MRRAIILLLLAVACRSPQAIAPPSTPPIMTESPPPPPERPENAAHVAGRVIDATGLAVWGPVVSAWGASNDCVPSGEPVVVTGGMGGEFTLKVERGVGPAEYGCLVVEATAGGSTQRVQQPIVFAAGGPDEANSAEVLIQLPRAGELTEERARALIELLATAIRGDEAAIARLDPYVAGDRHRVHSALDAYRSYLRGVQSIRFEEGEGTSGPGGHGTQSMRYRLYGVADRSVTTTVHRETLVMLHGPLIDYGDRASAFVRAVIDAAHHGDPERMSRVLTADDEDIPLATAQRVIDRLRAKFDLPRASAVLVGVDEPGNALRYRVSGHSREGTLEEEILVVGYGDGLVGLRNP